METSVSDILLMLRMLHDWQDESKTLSILLFRRDMSTARGVRTLA